MDVGTGGLTYLKTIDGTRLENVHFKWRPDNRAVETVSPGEEFRVLIPDSSTMQIRESHTRDDLGSIDASRFDGAVGPVHIEGAEPGDAVEIHIKSLKPGKWGWTAILGNFGLLQGKFDEELIIWDIGNDFAEAREPFLAGIRVPVKPFLGVVGVAPAEGEYGMIPPQYFGGNMDNKLLGEGARLFLPVSVKGALLSFADPHASQGDGEICGTAIETSAEITATVKLHKGMKLRYPRLFSHENTTGREVITMGIGPDLHEASKEAAMEMIGLLTGYGLSPKEAYALCSVAGNLRISEIVDEPHFVVSMVMPEQIVEKLMQNR